MRSFPDSTSWNVISPNRKRCSTTCCSICCIQPQVQNTAETIFSATHARTMTSCATCQ